MFPCSNCVTSGLACQAGSSIDARPPDNSALVRLAPLPILWQIFIFSYSYSEAFLRHIHERLSNIEKAVSYYGSGHGRTNSEPTKITTRVESPSVSKNNTSIVEGESSFKQQVLLASQAAELNAIQKGDSPTVACKLAELRNLIQGRAVADNADRMDVGESSVVSTVDGYELPPSKFVLQVLAWAKGYPNFAILVGPDALIIG